MLFLVDGGDVFLPSFLHIRPEIVTMMMMMEGEEEGEAVEGEKIVSSAVAVGLAGRCRNLRKTGVVGVVGDTGVGHERLGLGVGESEDVVWLMDGEKNLVRLLLLLRPLLHALNLGPGFEADDDGADAVADDDSCEDPDSDPCCCRCCAFPLPAFNEAVHFFLVGG